MYTTNCNSARVRWKLRAEFRLIKQTPIIIFFYQTRKKSMGRDCDIQSRAYSKSSSEFLPVLICRNTVLGLWKKFWYLLSACSEITKVNVVHNSYNVLRALFPEDHSYCLSIICIYACTVCSMISYVVNINVKRVVSMEIG